MTILQGNGRPIAQKSGEIWTGQANLQPISFKSDRLPGRNAYTVYTDQMGLRVRERLDLEHELRDALQREAFRLLYQPIVDMRSGRIIAVEALVRWVMPDGQLRAPAAFILKTAVSRFRLHDFRSSGWLEAGRYWRG